MTRGASTLQDLSAAKLGSVSTRRLVNPGPDALIDQDGMLWEAGAVREADTSPRRTDTPTVWVCAALRRGALIDLGDPIVEA